VREEGRRRRRTKRRGRRRGGAGWGETLYVDMAAR
jgi:hypothetical protein